MFQHMETALWRSTAIELASAIAKGEVGAVEVVHAHLARIAAVNPAANAITNFLEQGGA